MIANLKLHLYFLIFNLSLKCFCCIDDSLLFTVTRPPRYFGVLQDHRGQPVSVELSQEYMDQDYIATNRRRHKINFKNPLDIDDFDDDDTDEFVEDKDKDIKLSNKLNLQAGPV